MVQKMTQTITQRTTQTMTQTMTDDDTYNYANNDTDKLHRVKSSQGKISLFQQEHCMHITIIDRNNTCHIQ